MEPIIGTPKKEEPKKAEAKKPTEAKKAEAKKAEAKKAEKFTLPLKVTSGYSNFTLEGEGELTLDGLKAKLFETNRMFAPKIIKVTAMGDGVNVVFKSLPKSTAVLDKEYTVLLNGFEMPLGTDLQEEPDDGEEGAGAPLVADTAAKLWEAQYPEFRGSSYLVDEEKGIVVPIMKQTMSSNLTLPFTVRVFGGESFEVTEADIKAKAVDGKVPASKVQTFATGKLGLTAGLNVTANGVYAVPSTDSSNAGNSNTKEPEKVIPVNVNLRIFGSSITLNAADFGGKEEVTEKELLTWLASPTGGAFPEFAPSRGASVVYDKKSNLAYPVMQAARKGNGETVCSLEEAGRLLEEEDCFFT